MKIAIIGDTHLAYPRFEEDSFKQAEEAFQKADKEADLIIQTGDMFDHRLPRFDVIKRSIAILSKIKKPIIAIHGNHERRPKEQTNILQLLSSVGIIKYIHNDVFSYGEVSILGIGNVPEDMAEKAIELAIQKNINKMKGFKILVIHQGIKELGYEGLSLDFLERLPFDLIIDGHIHKKATLLGGKLILPGSTVVTQLREEEATPRGIFIYDTSSKKLEEVSIRSRPFFIKEVTFSGEGIDDARRKILDVFQQIRAEHPNAIVKLKLKGQLKEGLSLSDLMLKNIDGLFIQNLMEEKDLEEKIAEIREMKENILSVRERIMTEINKALADKVSFSPSELFEILSEDVEKSYDYIMERITEAKKVEKTRSPRVSYPLESGEKQGRGVRYLPLFPDSER